MKKQVLSLFALGVGFLGFSQTEVYFKYDEGGNQRYRGPDVNARNSNDDNSKIQTTSITNSPMIDEKSFWKEVRLYPVPVNDFLTIDWTEDVDDLIESVSLFEHSTVHWKFQQQNISSLNRKLHIDMTTYRWGVYILKFTLKDGRIFSKNVTKR